ncbi:MAG: DedA family protein [Campylobacteraceae bacterium]|nr:DedA family protein [Campylobacteraceae bacterium]
MVYLILFISAFISATLFPLGSEALLIYNIKENYNIYLLLFFATTGNVLGSVLNYYLGLKGELYCERKKYLKKETINKYKSIFDKYGSYTLLLSWMPLIGDPLTFIAGILKYNFKKFLVLVFIAKFIRYAFIIYLVY